MAIAGTDNTLTIDANVFHYYYLFIMGHPLPNGLRVRRINDFCVFVLNKYPIAINDFIRSEYENLAGLAFTKNWLTKRLQKELAIDVDCLPLSTKISKCLQNDYGFNCRSMDSKYLQTCLNTIFKHLVTENTIHFCRQHRNRRRRSMPVYLEHTLGIHIYIIDECCKILLDC